jgi:cyclin-dependent kinase regulatory subunit CKS1
MPHYPEKIEYSNKYQDKVYEYKHVLLPKETFEKMQENMQENTLLTEEEWRKMGLEMTRGWNHYTIHKPEPHILLFRRPLGTDPGTGLVSEEIQKKVDEFERKRPVYYNLK